MPTKIAFINMPFGFHIYPSIQLGTLSTLVKSHGWESHSFYFNLQFAHQIELPVYNQLCEERHLIGEWLFSEILFGASPKNQSYSNRYSFHLEHVAQKIDRPVEFLLDVKKKMVPEFLHWATESVDWTLFDVVGFSSTFNQNIASLTLSKLIKEKNPEVKILFGGSNFESEMGLEYFKAFTWIDYAVLGEAEPVLPKLMDAIDTNGEPPSGVAYRKDEEIVFEQCTETFQNFADYGPPDYDDFYDQIKQIDPNSPLLENPIVLYETARGCWWGEKHHCTFCGLNAFTMDFRSKPPEQVRKEIAELSQKYDTFRFRIVDNILEMKYIDGVFENFAQENYDFQFFIEVKSNLTKKQIKTLAHGGVNVIQPGIESFSPNQLREMDKGVRPIQNITCLKWSMYYGIDCEWNILTGFPGETDDDYRKQIDILKHLTHLKPPIGVGDLWLERFSPYFTKPEEYGVKITGPSEAYGFVYDEKQLDLMKIAYDFEFETPARIDPALVQELRDVVTNWENRHKSDQIPFLFFTKSPNFVNVYDGRPSDQPIKKRFEGEMASIISFCNESPKSPEQIREFIQNKSQKLDSGQPLELILQDLIQQGIIFGEKGKYLTLAFPHNSNM
jgi:ribosomal peptide maturation radical SAM protein 1